MQTLVLASQVDQVLQDIPCLFFHFCAISCYIKWVPCSVPEVILYVFCIYPVLGLESSNADFFNFILRISHVRDFITKYQGSEGRVPFTLTTSLPFRELRDETLTLQEAKLQNAVVVQRLRKTTEPFRLLKAPDNDCKTAATSNGQLKNEQKSTIKSTRSN